MTLVDVAAIKAYLRVQHSAEDSTFTILRAEAIARITKYVGRPIVAEERAFRDPAETVVAYSAVTQLILPYGPIDGDASDDVDVVDKDGTAVPVADYTVDFAAGIIRAEPGISFSNGPYTITATVGLSAHPAYATEVEPLVNGAILDLVAEDYYHRNPGVRSESAAGGLSRTYADDELPPKTRGKLRHLRVERIA